MRYWFHSDSESVFALDVPPPDGQDMLEINEDTYKEIVAAQPSPEPLRLPPITEPLPPASPKPPPTWADLARIWREMEDTMDNLKAECEAKVKEIKAKQDKYSEVMLGQMNLMKADKLETVAGEIIRREETHVNAADWSAIYRFVVENDKFEFIQKRLTSSEILKWSAGNGGELPPGMNQFTKYKLTVKKPGGRKALPKDDEGAN
jgi:hypothetical protein